MNVMPHLAHFPLVGKSELKSKLSFHFANEVTLRVHIFYCYIKTAQ